MKREIVFLMIGFMFFGLLSAQNINAQSTDDTQRIVGTWVSNVVGSYTFNTNGTVTSTVYGNGRYFISNSKLLMHFSRTFAMDYYFSSDGRILVLIDEDDDAYWYEKR
jgi:hypothetical protein